MSRPLMRWAASVVCWTLGLATFGRSMRLHTAALATSAGVVGAMVTFIAQDAIRDAISGTAILLEDQFGVDDVIESGTISGTVETFNMRATRVRGMDGGLTTVPNSDLRWVKNLSNVWGQVDYKVSVAYATNPDQALEVLRSVSEGPAPGVERPCGGAAQLAVRRELNRRVKQALEQAGIAIPFPQRTVWLRREE